MNEHMFAGDEVTLLIDGWEVDVPLPEGISQEAGDALINSMLGIETPEYPTEVEHPDLEFADIPTNEFPESAGLRTVCRVDGCEETEVFEDLSSVKDSDWTELGLGQGYLTDMTELHYAFCPCHSDSEAEGYEPEKDMGSHQFTGGVPTVVEEGLDE